MDFRKQRYAFFQLLKKPKVKQLLQFDSCFMIADKYHLASVFFLFMRANFDESDYNERNFHLALYLSHDINEDIDCFKEYIVANLLYPHYDTEQYGLFMYEKIKLCLKMNCDVIVEREHCELLFYKAPHKIWDRTRPDDHAGVIKEIDCIICSHKYSL